VSHIIDEHRTLSGVAQKPRPSQNVSVYEALSEAQARLQMVVAG
jgi:hypothetical protein